MTQHLRKRKHASHSKQHTPRRRRRAISGLGNIGGIDLSSVLYAAIGGAVAKISDKVIPATWDGTMKAAAKLGVGVLLPMIAGKNAKLKPIAQGIGAGFVAIGASELIVALGVMQGIGESDDTLAVALEGIDDVEFEDANEVSGVDDYDGVIHGDISTINGDISVVSGDDGDDNEVNQYY